MDRLQTATGSHQGQDQVNDSKDPRHHSIGLTNASLKAGQETHGQIPTNPNGIPSTLLCVQRNGVKTIPTATRMGSRH
jgi:hypothetical protein